MSAYVLGLMVAVRLALLILLLLLLQAQRHSARPPAAIVSFLCPILFLLHSLALITFLGFLSDFLGKQLVSLL